MAKKYRTTSGSKPTAHSIITDQIIKMLDDGVVPWRKPWKLQAGMMPYNATTKRAYSGLNAILLGMSEYSDPRWITYKKTDDLGGNVRKGEKSTRIIFWKVTEKPCSPQHSRGEICNGCGPRHPNVKKFWMLRYYSVFNVEQCEGLELPPIEKPTSFDPIAEAEEIIASMPNLPSITHDGGDKAFYRPLTDSIHLPRREAFDSAEEYYSTAFHETGHATGHESRLNRHGLETGIAPFGSDTYSREELVAEFTSAFLCARSGIENTIENSAAYIDGWKKVLKADTKLVITASAQGQKAANYILGE
jgi:antirestriction protein ArdC